MKFPSREYDLMRAEELMGAVLSWKRAYIRERRTGHADALFSLRQACRFEALRVGLLRGTRTEPRYLYG